MNMSIKTKYSRRKFEATRVGPTHKAQVGDFEFYITVNSFEDGVPGELFIKVGNNASKYKGWCYTIAILISLLLQARVPLELICKHLCHQSFLPNGFTNNPDLPNAKSIPDYIGKWLLMNFKKGE